MGQDNSINLDWKGLFFAKRDVNGLRYEFFFSFFLDSVFFMYVCISTSNTFIDKTKDSIRRICFD